MIRPKKQLGQHFLKDENIAQKIVASLPQNVVNVLEVGPGQGVLSKYLLEKPELNCRFVEIDREAADYLNTNFPDIHQKLIREDFLKIDLKTIFADNFTIIGNFPYNISSQIFFRVLENKERIDSVIGMLQKEVAERIASPKGNKKYGILSVLLQAFYDIELLFTVSEQVFFPPPKVKSAVIRLSRNDVTELDCDERVFFQVVKKAFNQRRKMLRNSLKEFQIDSKPELKKFTPLRPEQLSVQDFIEIARSVG